MTHIRRFFIALLCVIMLTTCVSAESAATKVESWSTVTSTGTCTVTMTVRINMDSPATGLTFPLPRGAKDVAVNGKSARTRRSERTANSIENRHIANQQENCKNHRHYGIKRIENYRSLAYFRHELTDNRSGYFGSHYMQRVGHRHYRKHEHENSHSAYPVGKASPEEDAFRQRLHIGEHG